MLNNKEISLKVPATTGNVGSGFDCIGLTVDVWNSLLISFNSDNLVIENKGVSKDAYDSIKVKDNLIITGILEACPGFDISKISPLMESSTPASFKWVSMRSTRYGASPISSRKSMLSSKGN